VKLAFCAGFPSSAILTSLSGFSENGYGNKDTDSPAFFLDRKIWDGKLGN
jgi:hypothetical protein